MSERTSWKVGVLYETDLIVTDTSGVVVTGLVNTDFTKVLKVNGVVSGTVAATVTEHAAADGGYKATYTADTAGYHFLRVTHATYNTVGWVDDVQMISGVDPSLGEAGDVKGNVTGDVLGDVGNVNGNIVGSMAGNVSGNVGGKVLGGGAGTIIGAGVRDENSEAIKTKTDDIETRLPSLLVSGRMDSSVGAMPLVIDTGKTAAAVLKDLLAMASGDITKSGSAYIFKDRDGGTIFTLTTADTTRTRS